MFLRLSDNSYVKYKPSMYIFCIYMNGIRDKLVINETACNILELCNGTNTLEDIISILTQKYNDTEENVRKNVTEFLHPLIMNGFVKEIENKDFINVIKGDKSIAYPEAIIWELTDYCPLNCQHCYLPKKNNNVFSKKEIDDILDIIDKIGITQVQLTGGEALTHPQFGYIVHQLIKRGTITNVSTSGMILNDDILNILDELKKVKGSCCKVSLDGNLKTHNYIRQNENSYDNAINFIKSIINRGIECQVGSVILNQPKEEIEDLTVLVKKLGVSLLELSLIVEQGNAKKNQLHSNMTIKDFHDFLNKLKSKYESDKFILKLPCKLNQKNCGAGHLMLCIKANGDITPCPLLNMQLGNLKEENIKDIIARCFEDFQNLASPCQETCADCELREICKSCIAQGTNNRNNVSRCNWYESEKNVLNAYLN